LLLHLDHMQAAAAVVVLLLVSLQAPVVEVAVEVVVAGQLKLAEYKMNMKEQEEVYQLPYSSLISFCLGR
jgi:hypothetical protein